MSMLKNRLKQLLFDARRGDGLPQRRTLADLTIQIAQEKTGDVVLTLECRDRFPRLAELDHITRHWPEPLPARLSPRLTREGHTYRLVVRWPRPLAKPELFTEAAE